ncbi:hypothetical protein P879_11974 [Paragonimus westermani]|uniref:Uncharacterized protein n=1 Tax=Paragonimus westermani TaxID=34504 RepID=A0A8T0D598_9TREM|nr:hypothetical protein P879_11974 [Paragonimus westermani]
MNEHINPGVITDAFKAACSGKDYLDESDVVVYFIDILGQKPSKNQLSIFRDTFDIKVAEKLIGVTLPKWLAFVREPKKSLDTFTVTPFFRYRRDVYHDIILLIIIIVSSVAVQPECGCCT